jgi:hypothetical protein
MEDSVFVVALLTAPGTVIIDSGGNVQSFSAPAGASAFQVPMQVGQQQFALTRGSTTVLDGVSLKDISSICICGIYNFNAYVGTLPPSFVDQLQPDGLASLTAGLHVSTCSAKPSLPTTPAPPSTTLVPPTGNPTTTSSSTTTPTSTTSPTSKTTTSTTSPTSKTTTSTTSPTSKTTTSTTSSTSKTTTTTSATPTSSSVCIAGTGPGNYVGLCNFCCNYGYCPPGPCTCTAYGAQVPPPPITNTPGYPLPNEDASYLGLCSYACNHGYCPSTACMY